MKYFLLAVLLCTSVISKALIIHPYTGVSMTKGKLYKTYSGAGTNYIVGLRLDHQFLGGIQLGMGFDIQKLFYRDRINNIAAVPVNIGSPAYTLYFHAGYRIRIKKFSIIPGLSIGGDYAKGKEENYGNGYVYPNSLGYSLGGNLGLEYGFKRIAIHAEFMPRYYNQTFLKEPNGKLELMNYSATLGVAIKL